MSTAATRDPLTFVFLCVTLLVGLIAAYKGVEAIVDYYVIEEGEYVVVTSSNLVGQVRSITPEGPDGVRYEVCSGQTCGFYFESSIDRDIN